MQTKPMSTFSTLIQTGPISTVFNLMQTKFRTTFGFLLGKLNLCQILTGFFTLAVFFFTKLNLFLLFYIFDAVVGYPTFPKKNIARWSCLNLLKGVHLSPYSLFFTDFHLWH